MIGIEKIDHICVAVKNLEEAKKVWEPFLGKEKPDLAYRHDPESIDVVRYNVGEVGYELMASTMEGSEIDRFLKKRGEGVMLVSFKVPDTVAAMKTLSEAGFKVLDRQPRVWEKSRYAFLNPAFMNGVLVEIID